MRAPRAFFSLGSNVGDRRGHLVRALRELDARGLVHAVSDLFETKPVGGPEQPDYLNLAVEARTTLHPREILREALHIEREAGRKRDVRWGPRVLDIDLLMVEGFHSEDADLRLPHPRMWERRFVLAPLRQLAPDLVPREAVERAEGEVRRVGSLDWRPPVEQRTVRIVGRGRAGRSMAVALGAVGWHVVGLLGRSDDVSGAARDVDILIVATPDHAIESVARRIEPTDTTLVVHLAGSLGASALAPHPRKAALHPLVSLPDPETGARRLLEGVPFALEGDRDAASIAQALRGKVFEVSAENRAAYHAAACIASNHLVVLMHQVHRVAGLAGVSPDLYDSLVEGTLENIRVMGTTAALTGPAARGDTVTLRRHLEVLPPEERESYQALAARAAAIAEEMKARDEAGFERE